MSGKQNSSARGALAAAATGRWASDPLALPNVRGPRLSLPARRPEIAVDIERAQTWIENRPRPWAVDLFSGCGGLGLGLERAGIHVVGAADSDAVALETYAANLESLTWCGDLANPRGFLKFLADRGVSDVDVVAGGPPCQPFSRAGSAKIRSLVATAGRPAVDERVGLWHAFAEIIDALAPRVVLLENVPDMATWNDGSVLLEILQSLRSRGFAPEARMLQAERYGVPQHRQRLFVVARRAGMFAWPRECRVRVDLNGAIADLPRVPAGQRDPVLAYDGPASEFQIRARRGMARRDKAVIHDHVTRAVREDDAEAFGLLEPGQTYRDLPGHLKRYREDIFDDKYKRLAWDAVSRSITAHIARDGYWYIHPDQPRTLSIREAARIQTFPDIFRFCGHPSTQLRQIGNAVPPALGEAVARRVLRTLDSDEPVAMTRLADRLRVWHQGEAGRPGPAEAWNVFVRSVCFGPTPSDTTDERLRTVLRLASTPAAAAASSERLPGLVGANKAGRLIAAAAVLVAEHGGRVPRSDAALRALPGVGSQISSCIRAFGFGEHTVIASEGTKRVVERVTGLRGLSAWAVRLQLLQFAGSVGPDPGFNLALMKLAHDVCRPVQPSCASCPVRPECRYVRSPIAPAARRVPSHRVAA